MTTHGIACVLLLAACTSACRSAPPSATLALDWPVPAGWKQETIPFPLDFAPELPYRGVEELRFMPGFSKPEVQAFWSYAFVWWLEEAPVFDARSIADALCVYFRGLALAVAKDKYVLDPAQFRAELTPRGVAGRMLLVGQVHSHDSFVTGKPIVLNVEAGLQRWPGTSQCAVVFLVSPKAFDNPVWAELRACASRLRATHAQL